MDFRGYLINQKVIRLSALAEKMWPGNKSSAAYLSRKLAGKLPFTAEDEKLARKAIKELGINLIADSKAK